MSQWPAIAAMLVAGLFSVAPAMAQSRRSQLNGNIAMEQPQKVYPQNSINKHTGNDSTITIGIKVIDSKTKMPLVASVTIEGQPLMCDKVGCYWLTVNPADLPTRVSLQVYAEEHQYHSQMINVAEFRKNPYYVLELVWEDQRLMYNGGDIYIEPQH